MTTQPAAAEAARTAAAAAAAARMAAVAASMQEDGHRAPAADAAAAEAETLATKADVAASLVGLALAAGRVDEAAWAMRITQRCAAEAMAALARAAQLAADDMADGVGEDE